MQFESNSRQVMQGTSSFVIPSIELPWDEACSPYVQEVENCTLEWGDQYALFPGTEHRRRAGRARYGWLASRCYPGADRKFLQTVSDYFLWFFLVDDFFIDRVDTLTQRTVANLTAMIDVLDYGKASPTPIYGELAWVNICERFRSLLGDERFERFANGMRLWASTAGLQIMNHLQPEPSSITAYKTIRRHTSGMNPCMALSDCGSGGPMTQAEYENESVRLLRMRTNNVVCWSNDVQSLSMEMNQPGQYHNLVTLYIRDGYSLQDAVNQTIMCVHEELREFKDLAERTIPSASSQVRGYIQGLTHWMRGYQDWVNRDTARYDRVYIPTDPDDRNTVLTV